jgi:Spy/CpxP family protein refolding chaperone
MHRRSAARILPILAGVLLLASSALAGPPGEPPHGGPGGPGGPEQFIARESKRLGLDEKTTQAIQQIVTSQRADARKLEEERSAARRKLGDILTQEPLDEAAALKQADVVGQIDTEMRKQRLETMFKIHALLTPEQRQKLVAEMKAHHEKWQAMHEKVMAACKDDMAKVCADAPEGRGQFMCMHRHRQELSSSCQEAMASMHPHRGGPPSEGFGPEGPGGPGGPEGGPPPDMP